MRGYQAKLLLTGLLAVRHNFPSLVLFSSGDRNLRFTALILSLALLLQFNLLIAPTYADSIKVTTTTSTTSGGITGQVPVTKVGALIAGDALAILNGTEIKIESKTKSNSSSSTPPNALLQGVLMQTQTAGGAASGYAVFTGGDRFARINTSQCPETVITTSGTTYTGSISNVTASGLSISTNSGMQSVNAGDIAEIHSARAYKYNIPDYANVNAKMSFSTTCVHTVAAKTKTSSDHGNNMKKLIIVGMALTIVAVAVAVPVAIACSNHHHNNNNVNNIVAANILARQRAGVPTPVLPAGMNMPTALTPQQLGRNYLATLMNSRGSSASTSVNSSLLNSSSSSSSSSGQFVTTSGGTFFSP
ncbi:MAG TPA: hypothetical protein V6C86_00065 [Oculatellaceae cyanobacterium]